SEGISGVQQHTGVTVMGFMDRVRATAEKAAEKAHRGVEQGQHKISEVQEKRRLDGLLRDLGAAVYLDRAGRATPDITSEIERLLASVREAEESGTMVTAPTGSAPAPEGDSATTITTPAEPVPEGSYKLDDV